ncbi:MAG: hypothetical protein M5R42_07435 [Rhodocyclaceae bacterium]|nr:hypothetical protein [Rhodocyclaceae bacterium]
MNVQQAEYEPQKAADPLTVEAYAMLFVSNGPDIPERLLQTHEDGRVVFFCGAGISYPARLPGFGGLVKKKLYADLKYAKRGATDGNQVRAVRHRYRLA